MEGHLALVNIDNWARARIGSGDFGVSVEADHTSVAEISEKITIGARLETVTGNERARGR
jgi:hypothetical protein